MCQHPWGRTIAARTVRCMLASLILGSAMIQSRPPCHHGHQQLLQSALAAQTSAVAATAHHNPAPKHAPMTRSPSRTRLPWTGRHVSARSRPRSASGSLVVGASDIEVAAAARPVAAVACTGKGYVLRSACTMSCKKPLSAFHWDATRHISSRARPSAAAPVAASRAAVAQHA